MDGWIGRMLDERVNGWEGAWMNRQVRQTNGWIDRNNWMGKLYIHLKTRWIGEILKHFVAINTYFIICICIYNNTSNFIYFVLEIFFSLLYVLWEPNWKSLKCKLYIWLLRGSDTNEDKYISFTMPLFHPRNTYPNHAISTSCDDDVTHFPWWFLYHTAASYGSFWAPGCGDAG